MTHGYYILDFGVEKGPFTFDELAAADLYIDTKVLSPNEKTWEKASDLPEFDRYFLSKGIYFPSKNNLASFWVRLLAYVIDFILAEAGTLYLLNYLAIKGDFDARRPVQLLLAFMALHTIIIIYNAICEATPMRGSIGKRVCKIVVVDIDGYRVSFWKALWRGVYKLASRGFLYFGFISILWQRDRQGWHDILAKTYVVKRQR